MVCWFHSSPRKRVEFYRRIGRQISIRTINRRLLTAGYPSRRATRYPRLKRDHLRRRRQWARRHRDCDLRQWRHCVFSDESRFKLYRSDGWIRVRRHGGEIYWCLCETNRWQCGMGCLSLWEQERASHCWRPHKPADTAQAAMTFSRTPGHGGHGLASQNPDMITIEQTWYQVAIYIRDTEVLVRSMPRRLHAVQDARGEHTQYQVITNVVVELYNHLTKNSDDRTTIWCICCLVDNLVSCTETSTVMRLFLSCYFRL